MGLVTSTRVQQWFLGEHVRHSFSPNNINPHRRRVGVTVSHARRRNSSHCQRRRRESLCHLCLYLDTPSEQEEQAGPLIQL